MTVSKSRTPLVLMEQLVMILIFALAAVLCVQAFTTARKISLESERDDYISLTAENLTEIAKAEKGDLALIKKDLVNMQGYPDESIKIEDNSLIIYIDKNLEPGQEDAAAYILVFSGYKRDDYLGEGRIYVNDLSGGIIYEESLLWQEVD